MIIKTVRPHPQNHRLMSLVGAKPWKQSRCITDKSIRIVDFKGTIQRSTGDLYSEIFEAEGYRLQWIRDETLKGSGQNIRYPFKRSLFRVQTKFPGGRFKTLLIIATKWG